MAEAYERGRPGYAEAALDAVGLAPDAVVLDLAAGTGKLTRQLVPRVARVLAVEPLDGMRAVLERVVPEAEVLGGTADAIPLEDGSVDAVFVAEAFHWFAADVTLRELARVLRPAGTLAILFNRADGDFEPPLPEEFWAAYRAGAIEKPPEQTVSTGLWKAPFPGPFEPFTEAGFPNPVELDRAGVLAQTASWSTVGALPESEQSSLLARLSELVPERVYRYPYRTELYLTRLRPPG
ncbi:MAG TPA: class I SAM-dependent methyltransferase [Solirubrobacteraceae bacterium]|nr:class I SAM-dependent methyltransferase [Solirubrobacteraceae bacterium]